MKAVDDFRRRYLHRRCLENETTNKKYDANWREFMRVIANRDGSGERFALNGPLRITNCCARATPPC